MEICMLGIDHNKATVQEREIFSFTKKMAAEVLSELKDMEGINGAIILSTCNRMELWVSCSYNAFETIFNFVCLVKGVDKRKYAHCFVKRSGYEAVEHLFYMACGLKSKVVGEDQILTQIKDALKCSRDVFCTDNVLETLFRIAITSAKQVKTQIPLSVANSSIIHNVIHNLKSSNYTFKNKNCMVIGNGEMGKLAITKLKEEGANVTVTIRQYRSGMLELPVLCNRIDYGDRFKNIEEYHMVISATASPNMTILHDHIKEVAFKKPVYFIDLAVPRDIDPEIKQIENVTLHDIDYFNVEAISDEMKGQLCQIRKILGDRIEEFISWYECRDLIPIIKEVGENAATDVSLRINKSIRKMTVAEEERDLLEETVHKATSKVVSKLIFGLRDNVSAPTFLECMEALKKAY